MTWVKDNLGIFVQDHKEKISYPNSGNEDCFELEEESLWFKQRNQLILTLISKHNISGNFLDIGGGNGFQAKALLESNYSGEVFMCEPGYQGCLRAKQRGIENVFNGVFQNFPFHNKNIKAVGLFDVVEHIEDDISFLNELYDRIPSNTRLLINVPASKFLRSQVDEYAGHYRRYDESDIDRISSNTLFTIMDKGYFFWQYYLPLFLLRVLPYKIGIKTSNEVLVKKERNNHLNTSYFKKFLDYLHKRSLKKINEGKKINFGTSIYLVLKK